MGNAVRGQTIPFWNASSKKGLAPVLRKDANCFSWDLTYIKLFWDTDTYIKKEYENQWTIGVGI